MKIEDKEVQGVIFDMDGLILDNGIVYKQAYKQAALDNGYTLSDELYHRMLGIPHEDCNLLLKKTFGEDFPVAKFEEMWSKKYQEVLSTEGIPFRDGFEALFAHLEKHQVPIALATSSNRKKVEAHLGNTRYLEAFDAICTSDDITKGKPDPEIYLLAASKINSQPQQSIVFEDSNNGMRAALAADCMGIMVINQESAEDYVKQNGLFVFSSLAEVIPFMN